MLTLEQIIDTNSDSRVIKRAKAREIGIRKHLEKQ